jgi:hypothetical protein
MLLSLLLLAGCGESEQQRQARLLAEQKADSTRKADSIALLLKPRQEAFDAAVAMVKERLKAPSTARFAQVRLADDTVKIAYSGKDTAEVRGEYDSQNAFGTYLHGTYRVQMRRDSSGKWVGKSGMEMFDVDID